MRPNPSVRFVGIGSIVLQAIVVTAVGAAGHARCQPTPDIWTEWKASVVGSGGTEDSLRRELASARGGVSQLKDPFTRLWSMNATQLAALKEIRVWRDSLSMVIVDIKPTPELLVVPKDSAMFLTDVSPDVRKHLANLAAAASDAMRLAAQRDCSPSALSDIYVNPPDALYVRQLHVHVRPKTPIKNTDSRKFYANVESQLRALMQADRKPSP